MIPKVTLRNDLSEALESMSFAAKICYGKEDQALDKESKVKLMTKILDAHHFSILEHANACFYISDVSRNFTHQFVRHRHMSFAQQSFHYTVATDQRAPIVSNDNATHDLMEQAFEHSFSYYNELIKLGMPKEEARHVLPSGIATKIVATASIREWMQFVQIRSCMVNCYEIREVARQITTLLNEHLPFMRNYLGPQCYLTGTCNEGVKHCGNPWRKLK